MQNAKVPPLFLIGTKFNIDLTIIPDDSKGSEKDREEKRDYRWTKRFGMRGVCLTRAISKRRR